MPGISLMDDYTQHYNKLVAASGSQGSQQRIEGAGGILEVSSSSTTARSLETVTEFVSIHNKPSFGGRLRLVDPTNMNCFLGLTLSFPVSGSDKVAGFYASSSLDNWHGLTRLDLDPLTEDSVDLKIPKGTNELEFAAVATPTLIQYFINGALVGSSTLHIPLTTLKLGYQIEPAGGGVRKLEIDNVWLTASR